MQKLLILEEQLYNAKSHHFSYYKSILSAAKNAGLDPVLYVNKGAEESVYRQLGATPAMLTMAGLAASGTEHVHNRFLRFFMLMKNLIGNLFICRGALTSLQKTDAVLCLSTWAPHVLLFLLFKILLGNKMPKTGLLFVWYPKLGAKPSKSFLLVRSLIRLLARIHRETFIFAETKYAKQAWHEFLGLPVTYVVHPVDVAESPRTDFGGRRTDPAGIKIQDSTGQDNGKTRNYTKGEKQGLAWRSQAAMHFQIPSQASLHGILKIHRSLAPRVHPLLYPLPVTLHSPHRLRRLSSAFMGLHAMSKGWMCS